MSEHDDSKADRDSHALRRELRRIHGVSAARLLQAVLLVVIPIVIALRVTDAIPFWLIIVGCVGFAALYLSLIEKFENRLEAHSDAAADDAVANFFQAFHRAFVEGQPSAIFWDTALPFIQGTFGSLLGYLWLSWTVTAFPLALQIPVLILFGAGLMGVSVLLGRAEYRVGVVRIWGVGFGRFGAFISFVTLVTWYLFFSACLTSILSERGLAELLPRSAVSFDRAIAFYAWQGLGLVPVVNANETLRWSAPLVYVSTATGVVVLLFKVSVFVPVIGLAKALWSGDSVRRDQ